MSLLNNAPSQGGGDGELDALMKMMIQKNGGQRMPNVQQIMN